MDQSSRDHHDELETVKHQMQVVRGEHASEVKVFEATIELLKTKEQESKETVCEKPVTVAKEAQTDDLEDVRILFFY